MKSPPAIERMETAVESEPGLGDSLLSEVLCPLCSYDLRGQAEPRCSECGYRFEWSEILDPAMRIHPFLFEHHPEKNIRSFFRTLLAGWRPKTFWSGLLPAQRPRRRRLYIYAAGVSCFILMIVFAAAFREGLDSWRQTTFARQRMLQRYTSLSKRTDAPDDVKQRFQKYGSPQAIVDALIPAPTLIGVAADLLQTVKLQWHGRQQRELVFVCIMVFSWPLVTVMTLHIFRWSMKRASIQSEHVLRCAVYNWDIVTWWAIVVAVYAALYPLWRFPLGLLWVGAATAFLLAVYRLARAYQFYLRFDRPWATVMASQIIVFLVYAIAIALFVAITFTPLSIL